jgi:A/G-specific adenine glycosylase
MDVTRSIGELILEWYALNARRLPWRGVDDPYAVWVSEIMLQQTQVDTVIPYYRHWMARFPDIQTLAAADEQAVLSAWEGLGYYARARNLWRATRQLVASGRNQLPSDVGELEALPGIGRYTAGAIASIAFGVDAPALDGNIKRVLSRLHDLALPVDRPEGLRRLWELAAADLARGRAGDHNQALMDLGALICLTRDPRCELCPLKSVCLAYASGVQAERPLKTPRKPIPAIQVAAAVIRRRGRVLIARRPSRGLLGGLWEFPGGKQQEGETLPEALAREIREELGTTIEVGEPVGVYRHAYTHFKVTLTAFEGRLTGVDPRALEASALAWVKPGELGEYPMGNIDRRIARDLMK